MGTGTYRSVNLLTCVEQSHLSPRKWTSFWKSYACIAKFFCQSFAHFSQTILIIYLSLFCIWSLINEPNISPILLSDCWSEGNRRWPTCTVAGIRQETIMLAHKSFVDIWFHFPFQPNFWCQNPKGWKETWGWKSAPCFSWHCTLASGEENCENW